MRNSSASPSAFRVEPVPSAPERTASMWSYVSLLQVVVVASLFLPIVTVVGSHYNRAGRFGGGDLLWIGFTSAAALSIGVLIRRGLAASRGTLEALALEQGTALDTLADRWVLPAVAASAALSLLLELAVIRWQASVFEFYAFYKNLGLLSCFIGLGIGYALARSSRLPLFFAAPLLGWQFTLLLAMRYGLRRERLESLLVIPFSENLNMGFRSATNVVHFVNVYYFVIVVFMLTALAFVPVGQLCGRLMTRRDNLLAYGMNLVGSLLGVAIMLGLSAAWTTPAIWFAACFLPLVFFQAFDRGVLLFATATALVAFSVLTWPVAIGWERIFSPYQLVERGHGQLGLMTIRAAGHYYQTIFDFSAGTRGRSTVLDQLASFYDCPYRMHAPGARVAVVGAGTGNDVAAALRAGAARVDAVEIDPAILRLGEIYHPEKPYQDRRVRRIINDARSFFRTSAERYDLIVYGLLDSHTLLSQASSVRIDSFVYTVEALREARAHLEPGGVLSLSFVATPELARKISLMLTDAFDGRPPLAFEVDIYGTTIFLQGRDENLTVPADFLKTAGFKDVTARYAGSQIHADPSTDDWPFFYMPKRVFPLSYVVMLGVLLLVSSVLIRQLIGIGELVSQPAFFFLGAGFMLIETKGITELGLAFGNTWYVIGVTICGVLAMAAIANWIAGTWSVEGRIWPYVLLLASLLVGFAVSRAGGLPSTPFGRFEATVLLTCPVLFSGLAFSALLRRTDDVPGAMGQNVLGAMLGGVLEYNSMYFGFSALYAIAAVLYAIALAASLRTRLR